MRIKSGPTVAEIADKHTYETSPRDGDGRLIPSPRAATPRLSTCGSNSLVPGRDSSRPVPELVVAGRARPAPPIAIASDEEHEEDGGRRTTF